MSRKQPRRPRHSWEAPAKRAVSFLEEIEHGFSSLSQTLADHDKAGRELSDTTRSVGDAPREMSAFAADIEAIGFKIKLVSLNAIVKSAQIGDAGASLAVLAEGIHGLSMETCQQTDVQSSSLRSIANASASLDDRVVPSAGESPDEANSIAAEMETILRSLREINTSILSMQSRSKTRGTNFPKKLRAPSPLSPCMKKCER